MVIGTLSSAQVIDHSVSHVHLIVDGNHVEAAALVFSFDEPPSFPDAQGTGVLVRQLQLFFQCPEGWHLLVVVRHWVMCAQNTQYT